jgi:hypothetical protein
MLTAPVIGGLFVFRVLSPHGAKKGAAKEISPQRPIRAIPVTEEA